MVEVRHGIVVVDHDAQELDEKAVAAEQFLSKLIARKKGRDV